VVGSCNLSYDVKKPSLFFFSFLGNKLLLVFHTVAYFLVIAVRYFISFHLGNVKMNAF